MTSKILLRRGTAAQWVSANPVLGTGELGIETDTLKIKVGNGTSTWTQLTSYANITQSELTAAINGLINAAPSALDTLNELAAAINNDSSFSTTVNNLLNGKVSKSGGDIITSATTSTIGLIVKATTSQTANILEIQNPTGGIIFAVAAGGEVISYRRFSVVTPNASTIGLIVKGAASQSANLQEWQDSAGNVMSKISSGGDIYAISRSVLARFIQADNGAGAYIDLGFNNGNSVSIVGRTSTSAPQLIIKGIASQTADLQQWQDSSGNVLATLKNSGTLVVGDTNPVNSIFGITMVNKAITHYYPFNNTTYQPHINYTRGNTTGAWMNIGTVGDGASGTASIDIRDGGNTQLFSVGYTGNTLISLNSASSVGLKIKGYASQSANLQEWQDSAGTPHSLVPSSGGFFTTQVVRVGNIVANNEAQLAVYTATANRPVILAKGATSQTANLQEWQDSAGTVLANITPTGKIAMKHINGISGDMLSLGSNGAPNIFVIGYDSSSGATYINGGSYGPIQVQLNSPTNGKFVIKGAASQSANLQEWQKSDGTIISKITPNGEQVWYNPSNGSALASVSMYGEIFAQGNMYVRSASNYGASLNITTPTTTYIGAVIRRIASQTADLMQWQDQTGGVLGTINKDGAITLNSSTALGAAINAYTSWSGATGIIVRGAASQNANLQEWQDSAGTVKAALTASGGFELNGKDVEIMNIMGAY